MKSVLIILFLFMKSYCAPDFAERARTFSIELVYFTQQATGGHVVISPLGVWSLLTGITAGATQKSRSQLTRALALPGDPELIRSGYTGLMQAVVDQNTDGVTLTSKNFLFLDNNFQIRNEFRQTITKDFGAIVQKLNFRDPNAADMANGIIQNSGANVRNVLQSNDFLTSRMILTNVISFKGFWKSPFEVSDTKVEPFYDEFKREIGQVNMMNQRNPLPFSNMQNLQARILELPYGSDDRYSMLIILPYPKVKASEVYKKFDSVSIPDIFARLKSDEETYDLEEVNVKLPRFKISTNVVLNKPLTDMGIVDIFDSRYASFESVSKEELYVSSIVHKAEIEVTETGTTASASSTAHFANRISPGSFHANKPFIYFIVEKPTATVLFGGIYSKPSIF
ncbi:serine protease inhibitor 77Ba-like [Epargyreus clarus]|uniref:serine protease inhibitor 77Ba-like n=1 Tax=Epargyreus clarus TaxID=520877 RepID=UPI003C30791E